MPAARQLRLLLWKDYLTRKRKLVTLAGVVWATAVILSIFIVRANIDNADYDTCQFPARALPSAGMLPFLQSFICSVNNDCQTLDKFDEIPSYENSKLTQLQRKFSPLLNNETVLDVVSTVPNALKLLSKLADIVDEPTFVGISKNGLRVKDLFTDPTRVKRYLSSRLGLDGDVTSSVMTSELSFQGILKGSSNRCNPMLISETLLVENKEHLEKLAAKLCLLTDKDIHGIIMDLISEVDFKKFIKMVGNMYDKLSGDGRLTVLADTVTAVLRMSRLQSFLPTEVVKILTGEGGFSYFQLELVPKFVDLFKPTLGETDAFKAIKDLANGLVVAVQYLDKFVAKQINNKTEIDLMNSSNEKSISKTFNNAMEAFKETMGSEDAVDVFNVVSQITQFVYKWLPNDLKHEVLLYSTLLAKFIEGANTVVNINMNIEERAYTVSLRHPEATKILVGLPSFVIDKGFEALADAERTQVMTSKIAHPGQMFCDVYRLQTFFKISKEDATSLKSQLCTDAWKNYITDLIRSFGIYEVKDNINGMASLFIQETLGKDTTDQLYSIDKDFQILKNFTNNLTSMKKEVNVDWLRLFNVTEDSEFMKTVRRKGHLGKQMLIVVHGALAKEVVQQNAILSYKISPVLIDTTTLVIALNKQLDNNSADLVERLKMLYPGILETIVRTAFNEDKTYKSLSTHSEDLLCHGVEGTASFLELPETVNQEELVTALCDVSRAIERGLKANSTFGKALEAIRNQTRKLLQDVKWTVLITGLKNLYVKLDSDYPYLFEYNTYGMDKEKQMVMNEMVSQAKKLWFGEDRFAKGVHLGLKFCLRLLDLLDRDVFAVSSEGWQKMKYSLHAMSGPLVVVHDVVKTVAASFFEQDYVSELPAMTAEAMKDIVPNIPNLLVDATQIVVTGNIELDPIISLLNAETPWPCGDSVAALLPLSIQATQAVHALESIWCMSEHFTEEWIDYLKEKNVTMFDLKKYNTTAYPSHIFLSFSSAVDGVIEAGQLVRTLVDDVTNSDVRDSETATWAAAGKAIEGVFLKEDRDVILKKFFSKLDTALTAIDLPLPAGSLSLHTLWRKYLSCGKTKEQDDCKLIPRVAWKKSLQFIAVLFRNVANDLLVYFTEINEPNSNMLQVLGFTKDTALYQLYDKLPEFVGVLLHSYFDFGFMSQIRRAALSQFWDCQALVEALVPPPGSPIDVATLQRIQPFVCPSFLYWLSLPRGDNIFINVVAKPNYYFYTLPAENLTSDYEQAYTKITELTYLLTDIANKNVTLISEEDIKMNSLQYKLETLVDSVLNYKINETNESYKLFYDINKKYFAASIYLTRIVGMVNKIAETIENLTTDNIITIEGNITKIETDLKTLQKVFKRRPADTISLHFDILTDVVWKNDENYTLTNAFESMCNDLKNNDTSKVILVDNNRVNNQFCSKAYKEIYGAIEKEVVDDYEDARDSLLNLIKILKDGDNINVTNIFEFFNQRRQLLSSYQKSIKYAYELSLPIYLQYLQSNLRHYDVIATLLAGQDWWTELRQLYHGPRANKFFESLEISFEIVEDVLGGLDRINLVRLLRDINVNDTEAFCQDNVTLSDYLPDSTGRLSELKKQMCAEDKTDLFRELPPLMFASQGYDSDLKLSRNINYTNLRLDLSKTEANLDLISKGPRPPLRPPWVTDDKITHLRGMAVNLLSKETITRIAFGIMDNVVDAGTLFLNTSHCLVCSQLTSWLKQLNLQIFKKQEYDNLLCKMNDMSLSELHRTLQNDFHWDMAIRELIQTRNYTKYELNKSLMEFLELVKLHFLEDLLADRTKLSQCLARNVTGNSFGNVTLMTRVLSHTSRLLRAETPHLQEIAGVTSLPYLVDLEKQVRPTLDVYGALSAYLEDGVELKWGELSGGQVNLRLVKQNLSVIHYVKLRKGTWEDVCATNNCSEINELIQNGINRTKVNKELKSLQKQEFWRFSFASRILYHIEKLLDHAGRLIAVFSGVEMTEVFEGRLAAMLDLLVQVLTDDVTGDIIYSLQGLVEELHPLLQNNSLERDLRALREGLAVLNQFKQYLVEKQDLKLSVSHMFSHPDRIELGLNRLGINNTNFWSIAAPRVHAGYIDLKPILTANQPNQRISNIVCQMDAMSDIIIPANLDVVTRDDVYAAILEQFCDVSDDVAKDIVGVLMGNLNFSAVMERVTDTILPLLYTASNLTESEGSAVLNMYPQMAALLPIIRDSVGDLGDTISKEPLVASLKNAGSVGGLLASPEFLSNAGHMLCGKAFQTDQNRFYKAIASSKDYSEEPDPAQLEVLPTEFCRDMYRDILHMEGGKIVWTFVKPLIMGKILYTPATPAVQRIIEKANSTFAHMIKLTELIHSFAASFPSLDDLSLHREGISSLRRIISSPSFSDLKATLIGDGPVPDVDVDGLFDEFGNLKSLGGILKRGSDLLRCINLNRFRAVPDEYTLTNEAVKLSLVNEFSAGLVFLNSNKTKDFKNVEYKIRMDIENTPTTARLKNYLWVPGPESSFIEHMRYFRGFIQIQDLIDNAIIQLSRSNNSRSKRQTRTEDKWVVYTQQEPYPCYKKDFFQTSLYESQALMVAFFFSLLFTVASVVRFIVADKETGNTMLMSVMGVDLTNHTLSWFISSLIEVVVTVLCMTIVLYAGGILPRTDPTLVFALLLVFGLSVLAFCYLMSKLFSSASLSAVCSAIAYLMTFMPFVLILSLEAVLSTVLKIIVCLSMSTSICYAFLNITRAEARGAGAGWSDIWSASEDDLSIAAAAGMALVDAVIYFVIGYLLDRFFGPKTLKSNITNCSTLGEKAGVSILNICKIYHPGSRREKMALDNVSIELQKGQITSLLGHNGAGKTTLIKILTGMLKPSKGHIIIRSERDVTTQLGICPQNDVLFDGLTASEHIALYAQLKSGKTLDEVRDEVDSMLQVLSLGQVAHEPVSNLSGGTRRRVCVALAFVCRPHLVSLDEPTAGVDPAARRDIWSMIVKLRENRTILLTTHHLDEAELLSDQIVIMHKGQVHTTGSPIEIKRSLGNGYKLTVTYPALPDPWPEDVSLEERTKLLVGRVRAGVRNATLAAAGGTQVELTLPFFDADGLHNDFLTVCQTLESEQPALGFDHYSMDCSSLEQVFFNICTQADAPTHNAIEYETESPSKSASTASVRSDNAPLVSTEGPLRGSAWEQFLAMARARYLHYVRNKWLLFLIFVLPSLFVATAMAFSLIRPPADNEVALSLNPQLYQGRTDYLVQHPTKYSDVDPSFAERVLDILRSEKQSRNWNPKDTPNCTCSESRQECQAADSNDVSTKMLILPNVKTLNHWIVNSHDNYIEKRYGGYSAALKNNMTHLIAWYNNKGHHAMPAFLNALHTAVLRATSGDSGANITVYSHPLKISEEQLSKDTVYQHIADAGISGLVLIAYCLVSGSAAIFLVAARQTQQKRLQLLCGVEPVLYSLHHLAQDMVIIVINMVITVILFEAFGFPVFVARNNLPAICLLILLYGFACGSLVQVLEKLFTDASLANMILFCGNAFVGLAGITLLLILDIISDSDETDYVRWVAHKVLMLCPQFVLADGMLEIAKNTIQAQVLNRFGMDTYKDPLTTDIIAYHYVALVLVGIALFILNLAIEYDCFEGIVARFISEPVTEKSGEMEDLEVAAERKRVHVSLYEAERPVLLPTIGNINAGFVDTEVKDNSIKRCISTVRDVAQCVELSKTYPTSSGHKVAVRALTLGIPSGQCTTLLGQNGAGKSTTFSMLTGEVRPSSGKIYLNEQHMTPRQLCKGLISYCPQSDALDPLLTVRETLQFYCRLRGISEENEVIKRALEMFDLVRYADVRSGVLSGGNKRKLCTAIALMGRTPLVLLDEPTSGMDISSRMLVSTAVTSACGSGVGHAGRGVLVSTHALRDAGRLRGRVALLQAGRLVALADVTTCLKRFGGGYVVACRSRDPLSTWRRVVWAAPHARLTLLHAAALHFLLPLVNDKDVTTKLSDIFLMMAQLQNTCDIEDYTINQSSLEEMFLSFTDKGSELDPVELEPLPSSVASTEVNDELNNVTSF